MALNFDPGYVGEPFQTSGYLVASKTKMRSAWVSTRASEEDFGEQCSLHRARGPALKNLSRPKVEWDPIYGRSGLLPQAFYTVPEQYQQPLGDRCAHCRVFWTLDRTTITGRSAVIVRQHTTPFRPMIVRSMI
jgi:hypothetical protein